MDVKNILYGLLLTLATIMFMCGGIALLLWLTDGLPLVFKVIVAVSVIVAIISCFAYLFFTAEQHDDWE